MGNILCSCGNNGAHRGNDGANAYETNTMSDIGYRVTTNAIASATYRAAEELDVANIT